MIHLTIKDIEESLRENINNNHYFYEFFFRYIFEFNVDFLREICQKKKDMKIYIKQHFQGSVRYDKKIENGEYGEAFKKFWDEIK